MVVVDNLGKPFAIELLRDIPRFGHVEHEVVAIVIVAHILVIEDRWRRVFEGCSHVFRVPPGHERRPVGIHVRHEEQDDVVANEPGFFRFRGRQAIGQPRSCLAVGDLARVQAEVDPNHRAALGGQRLRLRI